MESLERAEEQISPAGDFTAERRRQSLVRNISNLVLLQSVGLTAGAVYLTSLFVIPAGLSGYAALVVAYAVISAAVSLLGFSMKRSLSTPLGMALISVVAAVLCLAAPVLGSGSFALTAAIGAFFSLCRLLFSIGLRESGRLFSPDGRSRAAIIKVLAGSGAAAGGLISALCGSFGQWSLMQLIPLSAALCSFIPVLLCRRCQAGRPAISAYRGREVFPSSIALVRNVRRVPLAFWLLCASAMAAPLIVMYDCAALSLFVRSGLEPRLIPVLLGISALLFGAAFALGVLFISARLVMRFGARDVYMLFPSAGLVFPWAALINGGGAMIAASLLPLCRFVLKGLTFDESSEVMAESIPESMKEPLEIISDSVAAPVGFLISGAVLTALAGSDPAGPLPYFPAVLAAVLFLYVTFRVRREYIASLVTLFKERNTDILSLKRGLGGSVAIGYPEVMQGLADSDDRVCLFILHSFRKLMPSSLERPLLELLSSRSSAVQAQILQLLGESGSTAAQEEIRKLLRSPLPVLRARALEALMKIDCAANRDFFIEALGDEDPEARAQAAAALQGDGSERERVLAVIREMIGREDRDWACWGAYAAGFTAEKSLFFFLVPLLSSPSFSVRLKAIESMGKLIDYDNEELRAVIVSALHDKAPAVRVAAMNILAAFGQKGMVEVFTPLLGDRSAKVRNEAVAILTRCGDSVTEDMRSLLYDGSERTVESALRVLSALDTRSALDYVYRFLEVEFDYSYRNVQMQAVLEQYEDDSGILPAALLDSTRKAQSHAFIVLSALRRKRSMKRKDGFPFQAGSDGRELLQAFLGGMEERISRLLAPFMEYDGQKELLQAVSRKLKRNLPSIDELCEEGLHHPDRWVGEATFCFLDRTGRGELSAHERRRFKYADEGGRKVLEEILILKKIPLFMNLSMELLKDISEITEERHCCTGQIVFEEGDIGDEMYLIYSGTVKIFKGGRSTEEIVLSTLGEKGYFGEMALLDDAPRSASAMVLEPSVLSVLSREKLYALIYEKPEIAIEICRLLSSRLRDANDRLQDALQGDAAKTAC
jgi:CRP-like cAMP-binding protein/HEAT repeat protein